MDTPPDHGAGWKRPGGHRAHHGATSFGSTDQSARIRSASRWGGREQRGSNRFARGRQSNRWGESDAAGVGVPHTPSGGAGGGCNRVPSLPSLRPQSWQPPLRSSAASTACSGIAAGPDRQVVGQADTRFGVREPLPCEKRRPVMEPSSSSRQRSRRAPLRRLAVALDAGSRSWRLATFPSRVRLPSTTDTPGVRVTLPAAKVTFPSGG